MRFGRECVCGVECVFVLGMGVGVTGCVCGGGGGGGGGVGGGGVIAVANVIYCCVYGDLIYRLSIYL